MLENRYFLEMKFRQHWYPKLEALSNSCLSNVPTQSKFKQFFSRYTSLWKVNACGTRGEFSQLRYRISAMLLYLSDGDLNWTASALHLAETTSVNVRIFCRVNHFSLISFEIVASKTWKWPMKLIINDFSML